MKRKTARLLSALCVLALLVGLLPLGAVAAAEHTVWLVGDSTVCDYTGSDKSYYWPRNGYGMQLDKYLDGTYAVQNLALSGCSSKDFVTSDKGKVNYGKLFDDTNGIKAGDTLIIGFGHNDEKAEAARYTNPNGDWQTEGSFAKSLWDNYVSKAQEKGAEVILCTPIVRRDTKDTLSGAKVHITSDAPGFPGGDYPEAIRKLGKDKNVAVVDLTALTKAEYEKLGPDATLALHAQQGKDVADNTHLNVYGAEVVAGLLAEGIKGTSTNLAAHVDPAKFTPDKAHVTIGPDYKEPTPGEFPDKGSVLGSSYKTGDLVFHPTAFGNLGGTPSKANPEQWLFETDADGNMHMVAGKNKGKINATQDGLMMYWYAVPVGMQFTLTAKAKLNAFDTNNQVAFGLMARDDIRIDARDCYTDGSYPNYVAAGTLGDGSTNCFYRKDGALTKTTALATPLAAGNEYALSITSNSDGYACQFGDEPAQSQGFDFSLTNMDKKYVYVGMFTARNVDVTFSDISLTLTGTADDPTTVPGGPDLMDSGNPADIKAGGWLESLYAEIVGVTAADVTSVSWTGDAEGELAGEDLKFLVRNATLGDTAETGKAGVRIDVPGLKAGKYTLKVVADGKLFTVEDIQVTAHDRSGFAHQTVAADGTCTPYTEGVGAYNDDGTLKKDAVVLYVTDENKDTVTLTVGDKSLSGIGNILNTSGYKTNGANGGEAPKILHLLTQAGKPLVIRVVGTVNAPKGVSPFKAGSSNGSMCYMKYAKNVTIEGIGPDATIQGWGISFSGDASDGKGNWGTNFEVRNLSFKEVPEDSLEITGNANKDGSIKEGAEHAWVHNCAFYRPTDIKNPAEDDKAQGDGSVDFKSGQYVTLSYNYFEGCHKTSLIGADDKCQQYHVTWHHNYWKNVESRAPLARQADVHIYNNVYEGQSSYCMSLRANTFIFSESNNFVNCMNPFVDEKSGGVVKSYQDAFTNCSYRKSTNTTVNDTVEQHAKIVAAKTEKVTSNNKFANFDTNPGSYVAKNAYKLDTLADAKKNIETYGGPMGAKLTPPEPGTPDAPKPSTQPSAQPSTTPSAQPSTTPSTQPSAGPVAVTGVNVDRTARVREGGSMLLSASVIPTTAANKGVYWTSSDTRIVTVDQTGRITGVKAGTAKVTVKTDEGGFTAVCTVTVYTTSGGGYNPGSSSGGGSSSAVKPSAAPSAQPSGTPDVPVTIDPEKPASENFGDVVKDSWYEPGITYVVKKDLFKGVAPGVFAPQQDMTRAMLMTVLARLDGQDTSGGDTWYAKGRDWAMEKNISDGTMLDMSVTREQMVTMLYRYAKPGAAGGDLSAFVDGGNVTGWAEEAMVWAVANGILTGKDGGRLDPQGTATRAEVATILQRFVEKTGK